MKSKMILLWFVATLALVGGTSCRHVATTAATKKPLYFSCPMHPSVKVAQAGNCPLCGMNLTPAFVETDNGAAAPCGAACCVAPGAGAKP